MIDDENKKMVKTKNDENKKWWKQTMVYLKSTKIINSIKQTQKIIYTECTKIVRTFFFTSLEIFYIKEIYITDSLRTSHASYLYAERMDD